MTMLHDQLICSAVFTTIAIKGPLDDTAIGQELPHISRADRHRALALLIEAGIITKERGFYTIPRSKSP